MWDRPLRKGYSFTTLVIGFVFFFLLVPLLSSGDIFMHGGKGAKAVTSLATLEMSHPRIQVLMNIHNRHARRIHAIQDVVGTAVGLTEEGNPAIVIFGNEGLKRQKLPLELEGVPVVMQITGEFYAMKVPSLRLRATKIDPKTWFPRPVPIGVSTGNANECSAGTIGARVKDQYGNLYALSNNHVYARENQARIGEEILQPGLYDTGCIYSGDNVIGELHAFVGIDFSGEKNTVDAAIALSSIDKIGNSTPLNGYGTPMSKTKDASLSMAVQKYGRSTALTKGTITGIGAKIKVEYSSGTAIFEDQIVVYSSKPFIKPGDSGSLLVTYPGKNPVGLLFAGNSSGQYAIANPIGAVLDAFSVTIDGE